MHRYYRIKPTKPKPYRGIGPRSSRGGLLGQRPPPRTRSCRRPPPDPLPPLAGIALPSVAATATPAPDIHGLSHHRHLGGEAAVHLEGQAASEFPADLRPPGHQRFVRLFFIKEMHIWFRCETVFVVGRTQRLEMQARERGGGSSRNT